MADIISDVLDFLVKMGLLEVLAFLLVFVIAFGILERANIFGKDRRNIHIIIALALSLMAVGVLAYVNVINQIAQYFGLAVIALICILLIYGLLGGRLPFGKSKQAESKPAQRPANMPPGRPPTP